MYSMDSLIEIARVVKPLGIHGEVKVFPLTRTPQELGKYKFLYLSVGDEIQDFHVDRFRIQANCAVLKLAGLDSKDQVEIYRGSPLFVREDQLQKPDNGEYFIRDLIGLQVITEEREVLGTVTDVLELPAHDVYQVKNGEQELLIPAISDVVLDIDLKRGVIIVALIEGLKDLT